MKFQSTNSHLSLLEDYYNHFDEDKRLEKKHGYVEYITNLTFIEKYLKTGDTILDVGAGTGKYSLFLFAKGYKVTALDLMKKHVDFIKSKNNLIPTYQMNAIDLSFFPNDSFNIVLLFGPMYHLLNKEDRIKALKEAKRVVKKGGFILISYLSNEYAVITYGFKKNMIKECIKNKQLDKEFHTIPIADDLYTYTRLEDINELNKIVGLKRKEIISSDGPSEYMRTEINKMDEETYNLFIAYHLKVCRRKELLMSGAHVLDIVKK